MITAETSIRKADVFAFRKYYIHTYDKAKHARTNGKCRVQVAMFKYRRPWYNADLCVGHVMWKYGSA